LDILARINIFINVFLQSLRIFVKPKLWVPFFLFALIDFSWLFLLVNFYYPPVNRLMSPLLQLFYDKMILHYPHFYFAMPQIKLYGSMVILQLLFSIVLYAAGVYVFGSYFNKEKIDLRSGFKKAFISLPALIPVWFIKTALTILIFILTGPVVIEAMSGRPNAHLLSFFSMQMIGLIVSCLLIYAYPAIILNSRSFSSAVKESLSLFKRNLFTTFLFHFVAWFITFPVGYIITAHLNTILTKFSTNVLEILMTIQIFAGFLSAMLLYATITYLYISQTK